MKSQYILHYFILNLHEINCECVQENVTFHVIFVLSCSEYLEEEQASHQTGRDQCLSFL